MAAAAAAAAEGLARTMAFCEAPFDGTLDGTSAARKGGARPRASPPGGGSPEERRHAQLLEVARHFPLKATPPREWSRRMLEMKAEAVDGLGLTIFETVALQ
nr:unnamed protein product [Digitaria exilis]